MATVLQKQLAVIAANSTHQLDLKAQKQRHSKSLLFDPRDAASQSFDTIFQICYEGYEELCMLDARFAPFARNLFSEQSKDEDRTEMTKAENEELDGLLESFLGLVCGRLLLKPAVKALEWLVRRFRIQDYNTECVLLTFLPYHGHHLFATLMSILPEELPSTFRFLHPYVASLQSPPRHAVLSAAIANQALFSAFSQYVIRVAKAKHLSATLLGFWASITAQAVNGMIESTRSGRESVRKQREEDLLLRVLPVLHSAMSIKGVPELYMGSCVIIITLASKASLADATLDAMMEAVVSCWTAETITDGIACLALMSEEKESISQSPRVTKALLRLDNLCERLAEIAQQQSVSKLVMLTAAGLLGRISRSRTKDDVITLQAVLETGLLEERGLVDVLERLLPVADGLKTNAPTNESWPALLQLLGSLARIEGTATLLSQAAHNSGIALSPLGIGIAEASLEREIGASTEDSMELDTFEDEPPSEDFKAKLQRLPQADNASFWASDQDVSFQQYLIAFEQALASTQSMERLLCQNYLCKPRAVDRPTFLTFAARAWSSSTSRAARTKALSLAIESIEGQGSTSFQLLLPYAIKALADPSQRVRKAAAELCLAIDRANRPKPKDARVWADKTAYSEPSSRMRLESSEDAYKLLNLAVLPVLEDCVLDPNNIVRYLANALDIDSAKEIKKSGRQSACSALASQALVTPVLRVRLVILQVLAGVGKTAGEARSNFLIPLAKQWAHIDEIKVQDACAREGVDSDGMDKAIVGGLSHRTQEEITVLQDIAFGRLTQRESLSRLAFDRLRRLWPSLGDASKIQLADLLLEHIMLNGEAENISNVQTSSLDTLRNVSLPTNVLGHILQNLPSASAMQDQPPSAKKRRTSGSHSNTVSRPLDQNMLHDAVRRFTLVLELVEESTPERHTQLLGPLFHVLNELHHYRNITGSELVYLQGVLLSCLNSVMTGVQRTGTSTEADRSVIRTDLIVECVRTTSSTQIHNAALLLMSSLASWAPELVLHSVMPLFTFMSSTLLRQHDDFSAHVTDQTVSRIVPPLTASLKKKGKDLVTGAAELLASFTAAFEHIPLHRRTGLFRHLVETLGPNDALFAVVAMLVERYDYDGAIPGFVGELISHFAIDTTMQAATQYLDLIFDALQPKRGLADVLLGFGDKNEDSRGDAVDELLHGLAGLLENAILRERLASQSLENEKSGGVRSMYSSLLEKTMQLNRDLASNEGLRVSASHLLVSVLGLMPTSDFIDSSAQLMQTGSHETRQQVFRSLEARVAQARRGDKEAQNIFVDVLPNCGVFIAESQPIATRHAAISCVDQICEKFGKTDTDAVLSIAEVMAGPAALGSEDASLRIISILCLASMVEVLGDGAVAILPTVLTASLGYMRETLSLDEPSEDLLAGGFSLLSSVLDHLPWMLSTSYLDEAVQLTAKATGTASAHRAQVFVELVARKVGAQQLFASVERSWEVVLDNNVISTRCLLVILQGAIAHHNKATISKHASVLFSVMLKAFDLRRQTAPLEEAQDDGDIYDLLGMVDQLALDVTLQLNDATFRPFFVRLVEWCGGLPKKDAQGRNLRMTSLFSFTLTLFEQLKSIVTSYASFVMDSAVVVLQQVAPQDPHSRSLLERCLQTLSSSFQHDQDDFWQAPAHFDAVAILLVDQLLKSQVITATEDLTPTITNLAAACASSPEHLKTLNNRLMQHMKHVEPEVRLAAVQCERAVTEKLTFDWLALLPEMLPAISEAQEDDSEVVEREVLRWVRQIEGVTGEGLEGMLA